jgi:plasmid maintenance system antidote protein VapI
MSFTVLSMAALDLADALGTSPKLWINPKATYDLDVDFIYQGTTRAQRSVEPITFIQDYVS